MIFRRSAREICLLSSPIIELPEEDWPTDSETRAHLTLATDVLRIAPLNEAAAELGELGDAESVEIGIIGKGSSHASSLATTTSPTRGAGSTKIPASSCSR